MKTSEFIKEVEKLGFIEKAEDFSDLILIQAFSGLVCMVGKKKLYSFNTFCSNFEVLVEHKKTQLMNIVLEYAATPIAERRDKTIEDKAREYIQECMNENHDFYFCVDNLAYNLEEERESEIYNWYRDHSNEFVKIWTEVSENEKDIEV